MLDLTNMKKENPHPTHPLTLAACHVRTEYQITALPACEATRKRLHSLGLDEGRTVRKISGQLFKGPVVVRVNGTDLALGHGMASQILVENVS